jgi:hypothetical protein
MDAIVLNLGDSDNLTNIDFSLTLGGSISGKVFDNVTGASLSEVTVRVETRGYELDAFWSETDENGEYRVECLFLGSYHIGVYKEGYVDEWYNNYWATDQADEIKVTPPDDISDINFGLERGGSISGFVLDIEGNSVLGAQVDAGGFGPRGYCGDNAFTDTDGYYHIDSIPEWMYKVRVTLSGYAIEFYDSKISEDSADFIEVFKNQITSNINFSLDIAGKITGNVYDNDDNSPIQGIEFFVFLPNNEKVGVFYFTDYQGAYTIWLRTGTYYLSTGSSAIGNSYIDEWYDNSYDFEHATPVDVNSPEETSGIDFYLSKAGSISGQIQDINGNPISDASIYAFSNDFPGNGAVSGEDGSYKIEGLQSGDYFVQVTVSGYNSEYYDNVTDQADATLVTVNAPDETIGIDFILTEGLGVYISRPEIGALYLFDKEILSLPFDFPVIFGGINVKAVAFGADKVEFYVDDEFKYTDD